MQHLEVNHQHVNFEAAVPLVVIAHAPFTPPLRVAPLRLPDHDGLVYVHRLQTMAHVWHALLCLCTLPSRMFGAVAPTSQFSLSLVP